jgi:hypothetical protein
MLRSFSVKFMSFAILLFLQSSLVQAESILSQLPFDIKIGQTTNKEIENKGLCVKKIPMSDNYFRCELYSMGGGKFSVGSSENQIVSSVSFITGNTLPTAWQKQGIVLANKIPSDIWDDSMKTQRVNALSGTSLESFISIVNELGAENGNVVTSAVYDFVVTQIFTFNIGSYFYSATFNNLPAYHNLPEKDLGLGSLVITENY